MVASCYFIDLRPKRYHLLIDFGSTGYRSSDSDNGVLTSAGCQVVICVCLIIDIGSSGAPCPDVKAQVHTCIMVQIICELVGAGLRINEPVPVILKSKGSFVFYSQRELRTKLVA